MIRVFIAEDEFLVRESIKKNIDWEGNGYIFCGEASDGELALPLIKREKPDILITDIKMPFMDGLELATLVKKEFPDTEIIILTGYEKFEYAKESIKIGVAEYLSKPITSEGLLKAVNKVKEKIIEKKNEKDIRERYIGELKENQLRDRNDLFRGLVKGNMTMAEIMAAAEKMDIELSAVCYKIVLFKVIATNHQDDEYSKRIVEIEEKISQLEDKKNVIIFHRDLEGMAMILMADSEEQLLDIQEELIKNIEMILSEYKKIQYFGGIGRCVNRLSMLSDSYNAANRAFAHRYLVERDMFMDSSKDMELTYEEEQFDIKDVNSNQIDRKKINQFLKTGSVEDVVYFVEEYFKELSVMKSNIFRQYITIDIYLNVVGFIEELKLDKCLIESISSDDRYARSIEQVMEYVKRILKQAIELRNQAAGNRYGDIVQEVTRYIEENYTNEDLSLNMIASHINVSPNHLSMVFSQQTGQTFIKYLTDLRMNKAKELLRCTNKKSHIIALEVGYKDPHYFSYLFKKTQNMTPTQYRGDISEK